ncbi:MAG: phenylacetate--CoA ligase, partial [Clostridiales bacterium]|nr:phenylacetate--CoA ligase [Clostridiales bacterium]
MTSAIDRWVGRSLGGGLSAQEVERGQLEKLRAQLRHARQNSPYQRDKLAGVDIEGLTRVADLGRLPVTTDRELIDHAAQMLCVPLSEVERISTVRSSGTSGEQKRLYFSKRDLSRTVDFFAAGMAEVLRGADRCAIFMSGPTENSIGRLLQQGLADIGVQAVIHGNLGDVEQARLVAQGAGCYVGLPGEMLYLCRTCPQLRPAS